MIVSVVWVLLPSFHVRPPFLKLALLAVVVIVVVVVAVVIVVVIVVISCLFLQCCSPGFLKHAFLVLLCLPLNSS